MNYKEREFDRSFRYRKAIQSVPHILNGISQGRIKWDYLFTYSNPWSVNAKSAFIESILVGMPTENILCEENYYGELFVLDGVQRLMCLSDFFENKFKLQGLKLVTSLEGFYYSDLPYGQSSIFQNRAEIELTVISYDTDSILKFEFFKRINSDYYRYPKQLARNYAFREHLYFIRDLQSINSSYLDQKELRKDLFSIETSKTEHKINSDFDELYLLLCSISLVLNRIMHEYIDKPYISSSANIGDLLDDTAIFLYQHQHVFSLLGSIVTNTISMISQQLDSKIIFKSSSGRWSNLSDANHLYRRKMGNAELDRDTIVACFIEVSKGRDLYLDDIIDRRVVYRNNRPLRAFIRNIFE